MPRAPGGDTGASVIPQRETKEAPEYKVVSIRLRFAEYESFSKAARSFGLTDSMALRVAARRIGGFLEIDVATREKLEIITETIGMLSNNVAAVLASSGMDGKADLAALKCERIAFGEAFAELDGLLRLILSVSRRRIDGRARLQRLC
ncbi:T-DNA border endonuclease subunit VirD1 (plasmid) [Agrobacterium leguminum]|uniref:T-DNA border endonuclease virD1 n=1 Tax=Agrobacterium deltaense NCPPB 1641 TaxID=1183425 RepID=A0A1S7U9S0_9HYPH|nr:MULTISPECIES: T-DNA border endonuclease subunit VirD1 [Agrobacterium]WFS69645.1 T-DNA border endonuclease subunit VirD1 [Agrobacterium leguminum]CVI63670.1 T-DNA border endonuclease virD1 [Agrobacterium deltaense NCPPB 1641]